MGIGISIKMKICDSILKNVLILDIIKRNNPEEQFDS